MGKYHLDALERIDAGLTAFFEKQLTQIRPGLYEIKFPELKMRNLLPINNSIHPGAEAYEVRSITEVGTAEFVTDLGSDAPGVEVTGAQADLHKMRMIQTFYAWHLQEARAAQFAGVDLSDRKARAARRAIETKIDKTLAIGATLGGLALPGLFKLTGTLTYSPVVTTWADESPEDIYGDLMGAVNKVVDDTKGVEIPDTMVLPLSTYNLLKSRRMGDANNMSILKYFMEQNEIIKTIDWSTYLEADAGHGGSATLKRGVVYKKDPEMLEGLVNEFEQLPPEFKSMRVVTHCLARCGGVALHRPKSVAYFDGI